MFFAPKRELFDDIFCLMKNEPADTPLTYAIINNAITCLYKQHDKHNHTVDCKLGLFPFKIIFYE